MNKWFNSVCISVLWALLQIRLFLPVSTLTDNRCYLENGASSENFFVSEDTEIGQIIGQIHIHGDSRLNIGNIVLKLKESDSPITIIPGTKNLTLTKQLDKEGIDGPSSVFINLICERLPSLHQIIDPDFLIPINIRVTDVNDNSPIFINAPYILNISEVTVIGTRVLQGVLAIDNDQPGPNSNIRYQVIQGPYSEYFQFENELDGTLVLKKQLDYETLRNFKINIRALDHGQPPMQTDTILTVYIIDADDQNPRFLDDKYQIELNQTRMKRGSVLQTKPKDIQAYDQDLGINAPIFYTFNNNNNNNDYFKINRNNGKISLIRDLNDNDDFKHPMTLVIRAQQEDNPDRYALTTLTIINKRSSSDNNKRNNDDDDDVHFLQNFYYFKVRENLAIGSIIGSLTNNHPELNLRYFVNDLNILKALSINTKGELLLKTQLDYEEIPEYYFKVFVTDGITNDSCVVNVTVDDVNEWEPRFRYPFYEFFVNNNNNEQEHILIGKIEAADGDRNDMLTLTLSGRNASLFMLTPTGELRLRNRVNYKNNNNTYHGIANLLVTANDNGNPPRKSTVPITVHFPDTIGNNSSLRNNNNNNSDNNDGTPLILAGLGAILLILTFVIALLIAYICKARQSIRPELPPFTSTTSNEKPENINNPMFTGKNNIKSVTASAIGGIPTDLMKTKYPAPQPPNWPLTTQSTTTSPSSSSSTRLKKLSWDDNKTDNTDNSSTDNNIDTIPRLIGNSNLTVYF